MMRGFLNLTLALIVSLATGCRDEQYFGPYILSLPTELQEDVVSRTFRFPLDTADRDQQTELADCLANEPDREVPCLCDYPILTVSEQDARLDYRLVTSSTDQPVNVMVWVGREVGPDEVAPEFFFELPQIEVLAEHHHQVTPGREVCESFLEDEMRALDLALAISQNPACCQSPQELPSQATIIYGLAFDEDTAPNVNAEFTFRIEEND